MDFSFIVQGIIPSYAFLEVIFPTEAWLGNTVNWIGTDTKCSALQVIVLNNF